MKRIIAGIALIMLLLAGCSQEPPQKYDKATGEVVGKMVSGSRYGDSYYITVSYPIGSKFAIDKLNVGKSVYDSLAVKDKVTVYVNDKGVGEITK
jgi:hypothetical protein